jgi:hypothetical protein
MTLRFKGPATVAVHAHAAACNVPDIWLRAQSTDACYQMGKSAALPLQCQQCWRTSLVRLRLRACIPIKKHSAHMRKAHTAEARQPHQRALRVRAPSAKRQRERRSDRAECGGNAFADIRCNDVSLAAAAVKGHALRWRRAGPKHQRLHPVLHRCSASVVHRSHFHLLLFKQTSSARSCGRWHYQGRHGSPLA